ncbi:exonuclease SbcCD subunit D [Saccharomonospora sp. CUA-673]|uniref:exonuclease SbcCD subunit D n=1 Tax=Saccharomonospora sp. CUA-673 TaxID=1904969 RepID=UPI0009643577|nr:exonuclease SbcCD subunit D [Saccharomonospora sp. CUA-673]OLT49176.1 exonuclease SbcCD subunit D [Saccharomonospora sp. CUA-673]
MRMLHTSDWHVGRTFHGANLLAEQEAILEHLADLVSAEAIDVVLVAGDIYDRAVPSADAVRVATRGLRRIREAGAQLVLTSGNHDSAARLGAFAEFAAAGGLHLRTSIDDPAGSAGLADPVLFDGGSAPVAVYGIPYLEPETARRALGLEGPEQRGHAAVLTEAMRRVHADLATRPEGTRSIVLAHAFVTGGMACDSERTIAVGGVEQVPGSVFAGIDYVALGHLHGAQVLDDRLRYSGSPLAYSFSEASQRKSVFLFDVDESGVSGIERRELPVPRRLATVRGTLEELLESPEHEDVTDCFVSATLTDRVRPVDAMRRLRERFPHAVHLDWEPEGRSEPVLRYAEAVRGRSDVDIARGFLDACRGAPPNEREDAWLVAALESAGKHDPDQDGDVR